MTTLQISIISLIISSLSAAITIFSFFRNRSELFQLMSTDKKGYEVIVAGEISFKDDKGDKKYLPDGLMVHLQFLNPSPNDIAYFHLQFEYKIEHQTMIKEIFTQTSVGWATDNPKFVFSDGMKTSELPFVKNPSGKIPANSLFPLYAFISLDDIPVPQEMTLVMRYAVRRFPYITQKGHYKTYKLKLDLLTYPKELRQKQAVVKLLSTPVQSRPKSSQHTSKHHKKK